MYLQETVVHVRNIEFLVDFDVQGPPVISVGGVDISDVIDESIASEIIEIAEEQLREFNADDGT